MSSERQHCSVCLLVLFLEVFKFCLGIAPIFGDIEPGVRALLSGSPFLYLQGRSSRPGILLW